MRAGAAVRRACRDANGRLLNSVTGEPPTATLDSTVLAGNGQHLEVHAGATSGGLTAMSGWGSANGSGRAYLQTTWDIELAPGTGLYVTAKYDSAMDRQSGIPSNELYGYTGINAGAYADYAYPLPSMGSQYQVAHEWAWWDYRPTTDYLGLTLMNIGSSAMNGTVRIGAETRFMSTVGNAPPIPEPATWMMLGAGLLVAGAAARRRQR